MAVYYRYKDCLETFSLPVAAPSITVGELKRLIMKTGRHGRGRGPRESLTISSEQTREEYADDSASVLRNSTVVVRRRVAGTPADSIVLRSSDTPPLCPRSRQDSGGSSSRSAPRSAGTQDDQAKAISAVIENGRRAAHNGRAPPAGYVCHRCRVPGHFIQHCPTNGDSRFDFGRAPVPPAPGPAGESNDDGFPADLHCRICKEVMADAVVASKCCFNSFCDRCIRAHIVANSECACGAKASADDLIPNPTLRTTIANILAARASSASGGAEKQSSSAASNEVAAPTRQAQSPAASNESSSGSHASSKKGAASEREHSDGKSTSAPAAHETTDTAANHVDHQYGYSVPFAPVCYDPFLGGMPWPADSSMYYGYAGMPYAYSGGYPVNTMGGNLTVPPTTRNDGGPYGYHGRKRTRADCEDQSFKRRCGGGRSQAALVLT
ncbi:E3 ubiquitin ligase PQT3-like [Aegilops tauschii subsp. strangulata]|uniref:DWNN domain-containing protein n=2 Tax=Aegilops tauschii subsp. strangulata TaxID=200361 RepID=A0A453FQG7_AEGTS|nr:E3 ubiquitin ligase PARAQUAT TOLERANCE 3-like [Aegilops tauschii subsp. strangulata]